VNTPAEVQPREAEVESRIRKIRAFSRGARTLCAAVLGFSVAGCAAFVLFITLRSRLPAPTSGDGGAYDVLTSPLTPLLLKAWWLVGIAVVMAVTLAGVLQLYRLFGSLAAGEIHTPANVRRVRLIGLLYLATSLLEVVLPASLVAANSLFGSGVQFDFQRLFPSFGEMLDGFVAAGLILLVSWIMDVGLYEKQHADDLRRDADLVI
jgi:phosphoglycerol transferase MdoB-like AlkP superfamily enzyme